MAAQRKGNLQQGKKQSKEPVSYQAVHKALGELVQESVIEKTDEGYSLSLHWIDEGQKFFQGQHAAYTQDFIKSIEGRTLEFDTIYAVDLFLIDSLGKFLPLLPKKPLLCLNWNHLWIPLFLSREEYANIKDLGMLFDAYSLVKGKDEIDRWCADFWNKTGIKSKIGVDVASTFDLVVLGNFVLQVFYSPEIKQKLNEIYSKTKTVKELNIDDFFHSVFERKTKVLVKFLKEPRLAEELRKQTMTCFK